MIPSKFNILFAYFTYAGNGGYASQHPSIRDWWASSLLKLKTDPALAPRFDKIAAQDFCDTPITMTRNRAVTVARAVGADILVMVDSDQVPDHHLKERGAKPFLESSLEFLFKHYDRGPCVIGAPYCGPPPHENIYAFQWANFWSDDVGPDHRLEQYTREHAAIMSGIQPCAALPTGLIMFDVRLFDVLKPPYFSYEYKNEFEDEKVSTEDVVTTRDMSLVGCQALGFNPVYCNWDAWAGHAKPKVVGKPRLIFADTVSDQLANAKDRARGRNTRLVYLGAGEDVGAPPTGDLRVLGRSRTGDNSADDLLNDEELTNEFYRLIGREPAAERQPCHAQNDEPKSTSSPNGSAPLPKKAVRQPSQSLPKSGCANLAARRSSSAKSKRKSTPRRKGASPAKD